MTEILRYTGTGGIEKGWYCDCSILGDRLRFIQLMIDWYVNDEMKGMGLSRS